MNSFKYAWNGILALFKTQPNARIHVIAAFAVVFAGCYYKVSCSEWALLLTCIGLVLAFEAMNSALEALTDLVSPGEHPLAGRAKDLAAAAVLLAAAAAFAVGLLVFLPKMGLTT
jgi:diacylglycerol kinase